MKCVGHVRMVKNGLKTLLKLLKGVVDADDQIDGGQTTFAKPFIEWSFSGRRKSRVPGGSYRPIRIVIGSGSEVKPLGATAFGFVEQRRWAIVETSVLGTACSQGEDIIKGRPVLD